MIATIAKQDSLLLRFLSFAVRTVVAAAFIAAGAANISSAPDIIEMAAAAAPGVAPWLRYLVGFIEIAGAAMLLLPELVGLGAFLLTALTLGALLGDLFVRDNSPVETLLLFAATGAILWAHRRELVVRYRRSIGRGRSAGLVAADFSLAFIWLGIGTTVAWSIVSVVAVLEMVR